MNLKYKGPISYLRVFAMILIFACHIVQEDNNEYIQMTAQFLNVGVSIFIIISGYLYGGKEINEGYFNWIIKRTKRILIPMYFFMIYLLIVNIIRENRLNVMNWIAYIFNLQGFEIYVHGAEHLWYLTIIMICYLITPILNKYKKILNKKAIIIYGIFGVVLQVITSYYFSTQIGIYLTYIYLYIIAYYISYKWNRIISRKMMFRSFIIALVSCLIRVISKVLFDDSIGYNVFVVGYTQAIIAFCIFFIFNCSFKEDRANNIINLLDSLSFNIYLVHYMYIVGPIRLMWITSSFTINTLIIIVITIVTAYVLEIIVNRFEYIINIEQRLEKYNNV